MLKELKREAYEANVELPRHGLINLTFGNASAIDRAKGNATRGRRRATVEFAGVQLSSRGANPLRRIRSSSQRRA